MYWWKLGLLLPAITLGFCLQIPQFILSQTSAPEDLDLWIAQQEQVSFENILANIGGSSNSTLPNGVSDGVVIASPSRSNPDYFYQWVRDAAITMNSLVDSLVDSNFNDSQYHLQYVVESYIVNSYLLQRVPNLSGSFEDLTGLGEPKFMPDNTAFEQNWGRPQRDGPGLRAITISNYLNLLKDTDTSIGNTTILESPQWIYENILKNDLQYITKFWSADGFDLWEEINSKHLFTSLTQLKALQLGLQLARDFEDADFQLTLQSAFLQLRSFIELYGFNPPNSPYLIETPSLVLSNARSGLDIATVLACLRSHDPNSDMDSLQIPFDVTDSIVLKTLTALVNDMRYRYPINSHFTDPLQGVALGRYPEDKYNGNGLSEGNPWFISTATASEFLYKFIYQFYKRRQDIDLSNYDSFGAEQKTLIFGSDSYRDFAVSVTQYADSFLSVIRDHVDDSGSMSEQFNRYSGFMEGATDLTWSYGSLWSAIRWRKKVLDLIE